MEKYIDGFLNSFLGTLNWTWKSIIFEVPWYNNFFWGIIAISLFVYALEIIFPWRKNQSIFRKDFWLDAFYMFFNFFVFSIVISGFYKVLELLFSDIGVSMETLSLFNISALPVWAQLLVFFIVLDFVQWLTHILLHRYEFLWQFHKIHHSVKEMGFAAHMRYHWMENVLYKPLKTIGVMLLGGFEPQQAIIVHFLAVAIGHFNHSNIKLTWGPLKYVINNPVMHLWHHSYELPEGKKGVNYAISLSIWDYLFKTNHVPEDSGTITLGFPGDENVPKDFLNQLTFGFGKSKSKNASIDNADTH